MKSITILPIFAVVSLAACGGVSTPAEMTEQPSRVTGSAGSGTLNVATDVENDRLVVTVSDLTLNLNSFAALNNDTFKAYKAGLNIIFQSEGALTAVEGRYVGIGVPDQGLQVTRTTEALFSHSGDAIVSAPGNAVSTGTYAGYHLADNPAPEFNNLLTTVSGRATMTVDLENLMISGAITERTSVDENSGDTIIQVGALSDVRLPSVAIGADGAFSGPSEGGLIVGFNPNDWTSATGTFEGLVAGPNATETVGALSLVHGDRDGGTLTEFGVFATGH